MRYFAHSLFMFGARFCQRRNIDERIISWFQIEWNLEPRYASWRLISICMILRSPDIFATINKWYVKYFITEIIESTQKEIWFLIRNFLAFVQFQIFMSETFEVFFSCIEHYPNGHENICRQHKIVGQHKACKYAYQFCVEVFGQLFLICFKNLTIRISSNSTTKYFT